MTTSPPWMRRQPQATGPATRHGIVAGFMAAKKSMPSGPRSNEPIAAAASVYQRKLSCRAEASRACAVGRRSPLPSG